MKRTNKKIMQELIPIQEREGQRVVNARDLHAYLEAKKQFADWMKARIIKFGFLENQDFVTYSLIGEKGGRPVIEYALTLDTAKELAMVEGNAKGKQARQYFIECEKQMKQAVIPKSQSELILMIAQQSVEQEKRLIELEQKTKQLEARLTTGQADYYTIMGYAVLVGKTVSYNEAIKYGQKATKLCREQGYTIDKVQDKRFGKVNCYPLCVLDQVFNV